MAIKTKQEDPNNIQSIQRVLNKLISEEWLAGNTYLLFATALDRVDRNYAAVREAFLETAIDELQDHMKSLLNFAMSFGYDVPATFAEFKKHASKEDTKLFETFKKGKDSDYYLSLALEAEERAVKAYEDIIDQADDLILVPELQMVLKNNYYDEVEHLDSFRFLKYTIDAQLEYGEQL